MSPRFFRSGAVFEIEVGPAIVTGGDERAVRIGLFRDTAEYTEGVPEVSLASYSRQRLPYSGGYDDPCPDDCWSCDEQPAMDDFGLCASCKVALR